MCEPLHFEVDLLLQHNLAHPNLCRSLIAFKSRTYQRKVGILIMPQKFCAGEVNAGSWRARKEKTPQPPTVGVGGARLATVGLGK